MASQGDGDTIAVTATTSTSRLAAMKMRFQQKQQLEREQRRVEMTSNKTVMEETTATTSQTASTTPSAKKPSNSSIAPGKVRQMFDERRRGTGIDKSYPLKPLSNSNSNQRSTSGSSSTVSNSGHVTRKTTTTINSTNRNGNIATNKMQTTKATTRPLKKPVTTTAGLKKTPVNVGRPNESLSSSSISSQRKITTTTTAVGERNNSSNDFDYFDNQNNNIDDDYDDDDMDEYDGMNDNTNFMRYNSMSREESLGSNSFEDEAFRGDINLNNTMPGKKLHNIGKQNLSEQGDGDVKATNLKLKPIITRKTLPISPSPSTSPANPNNKKPTLKKNQSTHPEKVVKTVMKNKDNMASAKPEAIAKQFETLKINLGPPPEGMAACNICGRHFNTDRIEKHEAICQKTATKKRKVFDSTKHRVKGTDAEKYLKRTSKILGAPKLAPTPMAAVAPANKPIRAAPASSAAANSAKKSNWRKKHEEFIAAIRAAKEVQKHLARGGKLSDLPPPPPSENPDYIQCPHCLRRFNEAAANRHIPKCANMLHNKPKNKPTPKKRY